MIRTTFISNGVRGGNRYWATQLDRLGTLLRGMHPQANVPLLLLYNPIDYSEYDDMEAIVSFSWLSAYSFRSLRT